MKDSQTYIMYDDMTGVLRWIDRQQGVTYMHCRAGVKQGSGVCDRPAISCLPLLTNGKINRQTDRQKETYLCNGRFEHENTCQEN